VQNVCGMTFHAHIKFKIVAILKAYFILYRLHKKDKLIHLHGIAKNKKKCFKTKKKITKVFLWKLTSQLSCFHFKIQYFFQKFILKLDWMKASYALQKTRMIFCNRRNIEFIKQILKNLMTRSYYFSDAFFHHYTSNYKHTQDSSPPFTIAGTNLDSWFSQLFRQK